MKTTVNQRFETMITTLEMNPHSFSKKLGVASTQIYNIMGGRNAPSFDLLSKIATTFPTVNITWLLTGVGPILNEGEIGSKGKELLTKISNLEDRIAQLEEEEKHKGEPKKLSSTQDELMQALGPVVEKLLAKKKGK